MKKSKFFESDLAIVMVLFLAVMIGLAIIDFITKTIASLDLQCGSAQSVCDLVKYLPGFAVLALLVYIAWKVNDKIDLIGKFKGDKK